MSKTVSYSESISAHPTSYDSDYSAYSVSGLDQGETDSSSTNYATINLTRNSGAITQIFYNFNLNIPTSATITSVSCTAKCYISTTNSSRITTRQIQLYSGSTAKGTAYTVANSTTAFTISAGTWTASELNNAKIRIYAVRGTSNTTTNYYYRFYGATLNVEYSVDSIAYEITASSTATDVTSISPTSEDVLPGNSFELTINASSVDNLIVKDNNTDVTSSLVRHNTDTGGTITGTPQSQTNSGLNSSSSAGQCLDHTAESPASSVSNLYSANQNGTGYVDYAFDFSDIPSNATIEDVEVKVYGKRENATVDSTHKAAIQLYSGSTTKGSSQEFTSTSNQTITLNDVGTWTRTELQSAKLRFTVAYYGGGIGGVSWNVTYSVPVANPYYWTYTITNVQADHVITITDIEEVIEMTPIYIKVNGSWVEATSVYVKVNGSWQEVTKVYKKTNGSWVESSDISEMFVDNAYMKGGNV